MKLTTAKTRKGILNWLAKLNPTLDTKALYDTDKIAAIHVNKRTGEIVSYETHFGHIIGRYAFALPFSVVEAA